MVEMPVAAKPGREGADLRMAASQYQIDIPQSRPGGNLRCISERRHTACCPVEQTARAAAFELRQRQGPELERQHATGQRIGRLERVEHVRGAGRQEASSSTISLVSGASDFRRCISLMINGAPSSPSRSARRRWTGSAASASRVVHSSRVTKRMISPERQRVAGRARRDWHRRGPDRSGVDAPAGSVRRSPCRRCATPARTPLRRRGARGCDRSPSPCTAPDRHAPGSHRAFPPDGARRHRC